jgi:hypothetical protein
MRKTIIAPILVVIGLMITSCDGPWTDIRDVPYRPQENLELYCGMACIQMWAAYERINPEPNQGDIYYRLSQNTHEGYIWAEDIAAGVTYYTNSAGYLLEYENGDEVSQDLCISACIASIKDYRLALVPFKRGRHVVLAYGYKWHYDSNKRRVADVMHYHDPDNKPYQTVSGAMLKLYKFQYDLNRNSYWTIVGHKKYETEGTAGYRKFLEEGGTYYGGPSDYQPDGDFTAIY